jgi:hypothetical protein
MAAARQRRSALGGCGSRSSGQRKEARCGRHPPGRGGRGAAARGGAAAGRRARRRRMRARRKRAPARTGGRGKRGEGASSAWLKEREPAASRRQRAKAAHSLRAGGRSAHGRAQVEPPARRGFARCRQSRSSRAPAHTSRLRSSRRHAGASRGTVFTAYSCPSRMWRARKTSPTAPRPIWRSALKGARLGSGPGAAGGGEVAVGGALGRRRRAWARVASPPPAVPRWRAGAGATRARGAPRRCSPPSPCRSTPKQRSGPSSALPGPAGHSLDRPSGLPAATAALTIALGCPREATEEAAHHGSMRGCSAIAPADRHDRGRGRGLSERLQLEDFGFLIAFAACFDGSSRGPASWERRGPRKWGARG